MNENEDIDCTTFVVLLTIEPFHFNGHYTLAQLLHRVGVYIRHHEEANADMAPVFKNNKEGNVNKKQLECFWMCAHYKHSPQSGNTHCPLRIVQQGICCYCQNLV